LEQNDTLRIYLPQKHVLWCTERQAAFYGLLCTHSQGTERNKKSRRCGNFTPTPTYTPKAAYINFGMWGCVAECNQPCQISARSVHGFLSPRWSKIDISHRLEVGLSRLQQCIRTNVLHCYFSLCMHETAIATSGL